MENLFYLFAILALSSVGFTATVKFAAGLARKILAQQRRETARATSALALALMMLASTGISFAQSTPAPLSLDIDVQPLFDAIGTYLPPLLAILAIGGGIKIAIKLGKFLIDSIAGAFGA